MTYTRLDGDTSFNSNIFGFPVSGSGEQTADTFGVDLRHVWQDSGWYVIAGIAKSQADVSITDPGGGTTQISADGEIYLAGFGKYLGSTTALDIVVADAGVDGSSSPNVAASFTHIGDLGENWQFGTDLGIAFADNDTRAYNAQLSLYPNRDLAFGFGYTRTEDDGGFGGESSSVSAFASWFLSETTVVRAELSSGDGDAPGSDLDTDGFGVGVTMRF